MTPYKLFNAFLILGIAALTFLLLAVARDLLIPVILAFFLWYLIIGLRDIFRMIPFFRGKPPVWLCYTASFFSIITMLVLLAGFLSSSVSEVNSVAGTYQDRFSSFITETINPHIKSVSLMIGLDDNEIPNVKDVIKGSNLKNAATSILMETKSMVSNIGLILIFVMFIFFEMRYFKSKLIALLPQSEQREHTISLLKSMDHKIKIYIGIKTFNSLLTSILCYIIMRLVDQDFALLWAMLVFLLNFIPSIGSIIATIIPCIFALLQFTHEIHNFIIVAIGISSVQMFVGNFLEPRLMGDSLNLSPLIIMISLVLWGTLWGIAGMFLCVPITVIAIIVFASFETTRPAAIFLSKDGKFPSIDHTHPKNSSS